MGLTVKTAKARESCSKAKHRGKNEHGVKSTNKEMSVAGIVEQIMEGFKSSAEKFVLDTSVHILYT